MPINIPGILAPFQLIFNPRLIRPEVIVRDIRQLDFHALKSAGFRGAVFDKDNCLTVPYDDRLVPELKEAWEECRDTFGRENVLIVSNSAGTSGDPGGLQAESVAHHLNSPVLFHRTPKPGYPCIKAIRRYFTSLPSPIPDHQLIIVGDRIFTDILMANRMSSGGWWSFGKSLQTARTNPLAVWTTSLWKRESTVMRWCEKRVLGGVDRWISKPGNPLAAHGNIESNDSMRFLKPLPPAEVLPSNPSVWSRITEYAGSLIARKPR